MERDIHEVGVEKDDLATARGDYIFFLYAPEWRIDALAMVAIFYV